LINLGEPQGSLLSLFHRKVVVNPLIIFLEVDMRVSLVGKILDSWSERRFRNFMKKPKEKRYWILKRTMLFLLRRKSDQLRYNRTF